MSKEDAPNFREIKIVNCRTCKNSMVHSFDLDGRTVYKCEKYDFFIPDNLSKYVCDWWDE